ncbi:sulfatase family protein [Flavobacterium algicola]|uniref:sulfatase family protein n=1 Tax=Flavobacterium algicola TaxID=556529 RepID=UPI001EFD4F9E|nr:arylsulfatase [Flavobacterium algicola]MCG9793702.1 arylsulfatase [Flavobacterium algicola]
MKKKILNCTFLLLSLSFFVKVNAQKKSPNIVVIMADDIGLGDIGYYHKQRTGKDAVAPTPNIDALFGQGMRFSDAHSPASLCAPTRFSMLTGNYSYRNSRPYGVWSPESDALIDPKFTTSARIAKTGGYKTAFFGKWGLGGVWKSKKSADYTKIEEGALTYGFDYAVELPQGIQNQPYAFYENRNWVKLNANSTMVDLTADQTGYSSEGNNKDEHEDRGGIGDSFWDPRNAGKFLADKAVSYINKQNNAAPFFLYYCSQAVHVPHMPPTEFNGMKIAGATPGRHGDMIHELDAQVGLIIAALKKAGVYENTLFIFTSDNGGLNIDDAMKKAGHDSSNGLSGKKGSINEGGHRVPFVAVWPGIIKPNTESKVAIVGQDIVATVAALTNQKLDTSKVFDSANLIPVFKNNTTEPVHQYLMHQSKVGPTYAIRDGQWKLIIKGVSSGDMSKNKAVALYDLNANLNEVETENLVANPKYANQIKEMLANYERLRTSGVATTIKK